MWYEKMKMSSMPEYRALCGMKQRCNNPKIKRYDRYGGRGIKISSRYLGEDGFKNFIDDVGYRPTCNHSIDRINNDGDYEPGNIRWATRSEQMLNTSRSLSTGNQKEFTIHVRLDDEVIVRMNKAMKSAKQTQSMFMRDALYRFCETVEMSQAARKSA